MHLSRTPVEDSGRYHNSLYTTLVSLIDDTGVVHSLVFDTPTCSRHTRWIVKDVPAPEEMLDGVDKDATRIVVSYYEPL